MCDNNRLPCCWVLSKDIAFEGGVLTITLPGGTYANGRCLKILLAQNIPEETTIVAPVVIAIGDGTVTYPLQRCDGAQVTAAALRYLNVYPVRVATNATSGAFVVLGGLCCVPDNTLQALTGDAPAAPAGGGA